MRIEFERTGGFMGLVMNATFDTDELPEEDVKALQELLDAAKFFELPAILPPPPASAGADNFQYTVSVELEDLVHTVKLGDMSAPSAMQPLLRKLTLMARGQSDH